MITSVKSLAILTDECRSAHFAFEDSPDEHFQRWNYGIVPTIQQQSYRCSTGKPRILSLSLSRVNVERRVQSYVALLVFLKPLLEIVHRGLIICRRFSSENAFDCLILGQTTLQTPVEEFPTRRPIEYLLEETETMTTSDFVTSLLE